MSFFRILIIFLLSVQLLSCSDSKEYLSPGPMAGGDGVFYVAMTGVPRIAVVSTADEKISGYIKLEENPNALCYEDGRLYVAGGASNGRVDVISADNGKILRTFRVGHTPSAILKSGTRIYVANRFSSDVSVINLEDSTVTEVEVVREPKAMALVSDGVFLLVTNSLPKVVATGSYITTVLSVIDTRSGKLVKNIKLSRGVQSVEDIAVSPDGKYAYLTHLVSRYGVPVTQLDRGWVNSNGISIIDVRKLSFLATVLIDDVDLGAANPKGIGADDGNIYVAVSGTHEMIRIDRPGMHARLDSVLAGRNPEYASVEDVNGSLSFLTGLKERYRVSSLSPQDILLTGGEVYMSCRFTPAVEKFTGEGFRTLVFAKEKMDSRRRGELAFSDASICYQGWQTCTSCHPDGRADALNWDQLNDGVGNPKNTKSMLYSHVTPPAMITGIRASAEIAVRKGILHTLGTVQPEEVAVDIDNYLKSLVPVSSPYLVDGQLSPAAAEGKKVFDQAQCCNCHNGKYLTNGQKYDVGFTDGDGKGLPLDVPTLKEVWRTAPYFHDGRAVTIMEVLKDYNFKDKHGKTSGLSAKDLENLAEYILSL